MSDQTSNLAGQHHAKTPPAEYRFYFFVIFLAAIPFAVLGLAWDVIRCNREGASKGVLRRAACEARTITSLIFSV